MTRNSTLEDSQNCTQSVILKLNSHVIIYHSYTQLVCVEDDNWVELVGNEVNVKHVTLFSKITFYMLGNNQKAYFDQDL